MMTRQVILTLATCAALPLGSLALGGCGSTTVQAPPVNVSVPPPQNTTVVQQQPVAQPVMQQPMVVGGAWVPNGAYDEIANNMALRARQYAAGFGVASDLIRANIRQGMEGVMVPGQVQSGYCYRIIAVSGAGVRDLDLFLYNPQGQVMDQDRATDNYPVLGLARPLCVPPGIPPQAAQMRVRAYNGNGGIGIQMFAVPFNGQQMPAMVAPVGAPGMVVAPGVVYR
jgi:hypothetical protein